MTPPRSAPLPSSLPLLTLPSCPQGGSRTAGRGPAPCASPRPARPPRNPHPRLPRHEPAPDTDPYDQSIAILAEFDARIPGIWDDLNASNNAASYKIHMRLRDAQHRHAEHQGRHAA